MPTKEKSRNQKVTLPPLDPAKAVKAKTLVEQFWSGMDKTREGKWTIVLAFLVLADEKDPLYLHYEHMVGGKPRRYASAKQFFSRVFDIDVDTLTRWVQAQKFGHDPFVKHGTTKLWLLATIAPLAGISLQVGVDPGDLLLSLAVKKGKPPVQKKFADWSKAELQSAKRLLKGSPSPKLPDAIQVMAAEATGTYRQKAGPEAPELLKIRVSKDGTPEVSAPEWVPFTPEAGAMYIALGQSILETARRHPQTVTAHVAPAVRPAPVGPAATAQQPVQPAAG